MNAIQRPLDFEPYFAADIVPGQVDLAGRYRLGRLPTRRLGGKRCTYLVGIRRASGIVSLNQVGIRGTGRYASVGVTGAAARQVGNLAPGAAVDTPQNS